MNKITILKSFTLYLLLTGLVFVTSCKKEYETAPTPYNELISFKVPYLDGKDTLIGVIEGDNIAIWWPTGAEYPIPSSVKPVIDISRNAQVSPASEEAVELTDGMTYTVTAQDGSIRTYTINLTAELPPPPSFTQENAQQLAVGEGVNFYFDNLAGDDNIYLQDDNNNEYEISIDINSRSSIYVLDQPDGSGIPAGEYYVRVKNKYHTVRSESKYITVKDEALPYIVFNHTDTLRVKRGDILSLPLRHPSSSLMMYGVSIPYRINGRDGYSFYCPYVGTNDTQTEIRVQIPTTAPIGTVSAPQDYGALDFEKPNGDYLWTITPYHPYPIKIVE